MPYIREDEKALLDGGSVPTAPGHLTYLIYAAAIEEPSTTDFTVESVLEIIERYRDGRTFKYADYATVLGCLLSCALELERQQEKHLHSEVVDYIDIIGMAVADYYNNVIGPYEDTKINENGDVLPCG